MCLELPAYTALDAEQRSIYGLKLDGRFLVEGPPGTGKSVVALHRAANYARNNRSPKIIMASKMLQLWTSKAITIAATEADCTAEQTASIEVLTYDSWFPKWFEQTFGQKVPREKNELKTFPTKYEKPCSICQGTTKVAVDLTYKVGSKWMAVHVDCLPQVQPKNAFESIDINELNRIKNDLIVNHPPKIDKTLDIIIDEGQDLPDVFYQLIHQFARSITVYADGAQVINDGLKKTLPEDIAATLEIEAGNRKLLVKNYRNAQEVALLAESFRPRDVVPAQLPTRKCTELPQVVSGNSLNELAGHVELIAKNFSNKSIGIFVKLKKERDDLAKHFSDHGFTKFQKYDPENNWKSKQTIDPCAKGVFIATNTVAKGLEFDIVIAACLESWPATPSEAEEGTFYVLLSRSKDVLKLAYNGSDEPIFFNSEKYQQKLKSISRMSLS